MAFQFASTNLVFEIGIVMWIFLGWEFTLAEFVGGLILIVVMWLGIRLFVTRRLEEQAREHAQAAQTGHEHHMAGSAGSAGASGSPPLQAWSDVAHNFRGDVEMLWKEITAGFLIAGFVALLPMGFFNGLFLTDAPAWIRIRRTWSSGRSWRSFRSSARLGTCRWRRCSGQAGSRSRA